MEFNEGTYTSETSSLNFRRLNTIMPGPEQQMLRKLTWKSGQASGCCTSVRCCSGNGEPTARMAAAGSAAVHLPHLYASCACGKAMSMSVVQASPHVCLDLSVMP